jgi:hypothetical protein
MPSLSRIQTEAQRLIKRIPETKRRALQAELTELCESHWQDIRGPEPKTTLAQALWSTTAPLADLFLDLYALNQPQLDATLQRHTLSQGLALLVQAEIERGNEAGVHIAHEPMMAYETEPPTTTQLQKITSLLRGKLQPPALHPHDPRPPLCKALAIISAHIKRCDPPAVLQVIRLLTTPSEKPSSIQDDALEKLCNEVLKTGVRFLGIENDHLHLEQHGHAHKPIRKRHLADMLLEIRQMWLG